MPPQQPQQHDEDVASPPPAGGPAYHVLTPSQRKREKLLRQNRAGEEVLEQLKAARPEVTEGGDSLGGGDGRSLSEAEIRRQRLQRFARPNKSRLSKLAAEVKGTRLGRAGDGAAQRQVGGTEADPGVGELLSEGFTPAQATAALQLADGDVVNARELLLESPEVVEAAVRHQGEVEAQEELALRGLLSRRETLPRDAASRVSLLMSVADIVQAAQDPSKRRLNPEGRGFARARLGSPLGVLLLEWAGFARVAVEEGPRWVLVEGQGLAGAVQRRAEVLRRVGQEVRGPRAAAAAAAAAADAMGAMQASPPVEVPVGPEPNDISASFLCPISDDVRRPRLGTTTSVPSGTHSSHPPPPVSPCHMQVMRDPVIAADGFSYERAAIEAWFARAPEPMLPRSPMTNDFLHSRALVPNRTLRGMIQQWSQRQKQQG